jgi:hypothetical protein
MGLSSGRKDLGRRAGPGQRDGLRNKAVSVGCALSLHALLLLGLLAPAPPPQVEPGSLTVGAGRGSGTGPSIAVQLALRKKLVPSTEPVTSARELSVAAPEAEISDADPALEALSGVSAWIEPASLSASAASSVSGEDGATPGCDIAGALQAQLALDPHVRTAVVGWPEARGDRATTRRLWNGRWADTEELGGGDTVEPVRRLVALIVASARSECLEEQHGTPLAFTVPIASGEMLGGSPLAVSFALGSEHWSWRDLLDAGAPAPSDVPQPFGHPFGL